MGIAVGSRDPNCGGENTADSYIQAYCSDGAQVNNHGHCPLTYNAANRLASGEKVTVTNVLGAMGTNALNSDGTARLTNSLRDGANANVFLPAPNAFSNHRAANFMVGHLNNLGPLHNGLNTNTLTLDSVGTNTATTSGFSLGRVDLSGNKYYVGILSGTNVGGLVPTTGNIATWTTRFEVLTGTALGGQTATDYNLLVDFTNSTIKTDGGAPDFTGLGKIGIDGRFTGNGLVYGNVTFGNAGAHDGVLTGLIGTIGAVGIFKSNDTNTTPYVGGFVADNPANDGTGQSLGPDELCQDLDEATPFAEACDSPDNEDLQVQLCVANALMRSARITDYSANCVNNDRVTKHVCDDNGQYANPFHPTLCGGDNLVALGLTEKKNPSLTTAT